MSKVVYRKNGGRRRAGYPLLVLCAVLLFGFSLVNIVWPKRTQLELENRKAAQLPAFSMSALLDGSWQSGFARWMQDQFSLRDAAVNTQRAADEVLFRKAEEGRFFTAFAGGQAVCDTQVNVTAEDTTVQLHLRDTDFQPLGAYNEDWQALLCTELQQAFSALTSDDAADFFHLQFWHVNLWGPGSVLPMPRLEILFE